MRREWSRVGFGGEQSPKPMHSSARERMIALGSGLVAAAGIFLVIPFLTDLKASVPSGPKPDSFPGASLMGPELPPEVEFVDEQVLLEESVDQTPLLPDEVPQLAERPGLVTNVLVRPQWRRDELLREPRILDVDQAPRVKNRVAPAYPAKLRQKGVAGRVVLVLTVEADGRVSAVAVRQGSGHRELDQAAAKALKRWSFHPAERDGKAVPARVVQPVHFGLR